MFGPIGGPEMVVILIVALLIFGPRRLPDLARSLGKGLSELRRTSMDLRRTLEREIHQEDQEKKQPSALSPGEPGTVPPAESPAAPPAGSVPRGAEAGSWPAGRAGSPPPPEADTPLPEAPRRAPATRDAAPESDRPAVDERSGEDH